MILSIVPGVVEFLRERARQKKESEAATVAKS